MSIAKKDNWVEIENIVLNPEERSPNLPEDTKEVPLMMWTRGFLLDDEASLGDRVTIKTLTGRITSGKLVDLNPKHIHNFGESVQVLFEVGSDVKQDLKNL